MHPRTTQRGYNLTPPANTHDAPHITTSWQPILKQLKKNTTTLEDTQLFQTSSSPLSTQILPNLWQPSQGKKGIIGSSPQEATY